MIPVTDERQGTDEMLYNIDFGDTFIWNDYLCQRLMFAGIEYKPKDDDHLLCVVLRSGELVEIGRLAMVTPCKCELTIVD